MPSFKILLVDDHPLVRAGIRTALDGKYVICGEAANGKEAVELSKTLTPDLVKHAHHGWHGSNSSYSSFAS